MQLTDLRSTKKYIYIHLLLDVLLYSAMAGFLLTFFYLFRGFSTSETSSKKLLFHHYSELFLAYFFVYTFLVVCALVAALGVAFVKISLVLTSLYIPFATLFQAVTYLQTYSSDVFQRKTLTMQMEAVWYALNDAQRDKLIAFLRNFVFGIDTPQNEAAKVELLETVSFRAIVLLLCVLVLLVVKELFLTKLVFDLVYYYLKIK